MNIFISCGHNNARNIRNILTKDQWAVSNWFTEYGIVKEVARLLPARYKWIHTLVFVPEWLSLVERIKWINNRIKSGDVSIELHMNAGGWTGCEVFYMANSKYMKDTASSFSKSLSESLNIFNRWAKPDTATRFGRLGFIRDTKYSSLLIELWFIDSEYDRSQVINLGSSSLAKVLKDIYLQ